MAQMGNGDRCMDGIRRPKGNRNVPYAGTQLAILLQKALPRSLAEF